MPRIPMYDAHVIPQAPHIRRDVSYSAASFGAGDWAQLGGLAHAAGRFGDTLTGIGLNEMRKEQAEQEKAQALAEREAKKAAAAAEREEWNAAQVAARDADNAAAERQRGGVNEYLTTEGKNAVDGFEAFRKAEYDKAEQEITNYAGPEKGRPMFARSVYARRDRNVENGERHYFTQKKAYEFATLQGSANRAAKDFAAAPTADQREFALKDFQRQLTLMGEKRGMPDDAREQMVADATSKMVLGHLNELLQAQDLDGFNAVMEEHGGMIAASERAKLKELAGAQRRYGEMSQLVDRIAAVPSAEERLRLIRQEAKSPEEMRMLAGEVGRQVKAKEDDKRAAEQRNTQAYISAQIAAGGMAAPTAVWNGTDMRKVNQALETGRARDAEAKDSWPVMQFMRDFDAMGAEEKAKYDLNENVFAYLGPTRYKEAMAIQRKARQEVESKKGEGAWGGRMKEARDRYLADAAGGGSLPLLERNALSGAFNEEFRRQVKALAKGGEVTDAILEQAETNAVIHMKTEGEITNWWGSNMTREAAIRAGRYGEWARFSQGGERMVRVNNDWGWDYLIPLADAERQGREWYPDEKPESVPDKAEWDYKRKMWVRKTVDGTLEGWDMNGRRFVGERKAKK